MDELFYKGVKDGQRAARWFMLNLMQLVDMAAFNIHDIQDWKIEGGDYVVDILEWAGDDDQYDMVGVSGELDISIGSEGLKPRIVHGGIEVKGISPGKLIERNDLGLCFEPTVPQAIWDGNKGREDGKPQYIRATHGSLRRFMQPEWAPPSRKNERRFSAEPLILGYMLECLDKQGHPRPYASIAFTDFPALKSRLIDYAAENGLDLMDWDSIPIGEAARDFRRGELIIPTYSNMWYVPLSVLDGLAKVTIIGDAPCFYRNGSCTVEIQQRRYQALCDNATTFVSLEQFRLDGEIDSILPEHPVFHLLAQSKAPAGKLRGANGALIR